MHCSTPLHPDDHPTLSIIVVSYNQSTWVVPCLKALAEERARLPVSSELVVVDNASLDGTSVCIREIVSSWHSSSRDGVHLVFNECNIGYSRAVNQAYRLSQGTIILVLNADVIVTPGSIQALYETLAVKREAGICAPRLFNADGSLQLSCRQFYTPLVLLLRTFPFNLFSHHHRAVQAHLMNTWDHESERSVDWVLGAALMVRRDALDENQLFDPRYFLYFEDVDLARRMNRKGWRVLYVPTATMIHYHTRSSATVFNIRYKLMHLLSMLTFYKGHAR